MLILQLKEMFYVLELINQGGSREVALFHA